MISHIEANDLLDLYGSLLSSRQQEVLILYFQDDLSLSEIRENLNISKAAVYDALSKGVAAMEHYESRLHLLRQRQVIAAWIDEHPEAADLMERLEAIESTNETDE